MDRFIVVGNQMGNAPLNWLPMSNFGEDLRAARLSRGVALEDITEVTKISQRHLIALEQNKFKTLPGGILTKGIVRGYVGAVGLDLSDWTERFNKAYAAAIDVPDDDMNWTEFAANVGKVRMERREASAARRRWFGAVLLLTAAVAAAFLTIRYFGLEAGWWDTLLPDTQGFIAHAVGWLTQS